MGFLALNTSSDHILSGTPEGGSIDILCYIMTRNKYVENHTLINTTKINPMKVKFLRVWDLHHQNLRHRAY